MSAFQNPTGITLAPARRQALIEVAARYGLPIVEDDAYGELYYTDERPTPVAAVDVALHGSLRHVVYISSFSKVLAPGLRVAWLLAPPELTSRLVRVKQGVDLHTNSLSQATVYESCRAGLLEHHVPTIRTIYRERRDTMLRALAAHMPPEVRWITPDGGMFVWVMLPAQTNSTSLFHAAIENDVAFVPGEAFYANGGGTNTLRLNFSLPTPAQIEEGIARLGRAMRALG
jgi:2-aminoadipate transaminase